MKVMISLPMSGEPDSFVKMKIEKLTEKFNKLHIEVLDSFIEDEMPSYYNNEGLYYMARSVDIMAKCDAIYFAKGWQGSKGCNIERKIAESYGLKILDEDFLEEPVIESVKYFADDQVYGMGESRGMLAPDTNQRNFGPDDNHIPHLD